MSRSDSSGTPKSTKQAHRVPPYKRPLVVGGFLVILVVAIVVTIVICKNLNSGNNDQPNTVQPGYTEVTPPEPTIPQPDDDLENKTPQYEGEDPNQLDELTGVIIYQDIDPDTNVLHSAVAINQYLHSNGQCVFSLERDGTTVRTVSAIAEADVTTSSCGPFSLSLEGLSGKYQIRVTMTGDDKRGTILSEITI